MPADTTVRAERGQPHLALVAGPLTMQLDIHSGFLRYLRLGDREVLRGSTLPSATVIGGLYHRSCTAFVQIERRIRFVSSSRHGAGRRKSTSIGKVKLRGRPAGAWNIAWKEWRCRRFSAIGLDSACFTARRSAPASIAGSSMWMAGVARRYFRRILPRINRFATFGGSATGCRRRSRPTCDWRAIPLRPRTNAIGRTRRSRPTARR